MQEFLVEVFVGNNVTHIVNVEQQDRKKITVVEATNSAYKYCTKFRSKAVAQKVADKVNGAKVSPYYGIVTSGSKTTVTPKMSKVNKTTPYKTI